jgi:glycosyltransferase involved in cell wall biosynthesis
VVVAKSSSLPEVVGDNAIFADPYDFKAIAKALELGVTDYELREELKQRGLQHTTSFSWDLMASQTLKIYEQCQGVQQNMLISEVGAQ